MIRPLGIPLGKLGDQEKYSLAILISARDLTPKGIISVKVGWQDGHRDQGYEVIC